MIKESFGALTKDDMLKPYRFDHNFRSTNDNDVGEDNDSVG